MTNHLKYGVLTFEKYARPEIQTMTALSVNGGSIIIMGVNFGELAVIPIVTLHGAPCTNCQVQDQGSSIVCGFCDGGAARIDYELVVSVDGLDSDPFLFRYAGI